MNARTLVAVALLVMNCAMGSHAHATAAPAGAGASAAAATALRVAMQRPGMAHRQAAPCATDAVACHASSADVLGGCAITVDCGTVPGDAPEPALAALAGLLLLWAGVVIRRRAAPAAQRRQVQ